MSKTLVIYGGSSLISQELIVIFSKENYNFIIFFRNKKKFLNEISKFNVNQNNMKIFEADLLEIEKNLELIENLKNDIDGVIWVSGNTGDPSKEFNHTDLASNNIKLNFLNPVLIMNKLLLKTKKNGESFFAVICSVAGLRGRAKNIFYGSSKSGLISYLSGLRQHYNNKINILTIIPGYMSTNSFREDAPNFLITPPKKAASIIFNAIKSKREIVYINFYWRVIMFIVRLIPEKIFKKLNF